MPAKLLRIAFCATAALASFHVAAGALRPHACGVEVGMTRAAVEKWYPELHCGALASLVMRCAAEVVKQHALAPCGGRLSSLSIDFDLEGRVSRARAIVDGQEMFRIVREFARSLGDPEVRGIYEWHAAHLWATQNATLVISGRRAGPQPQTEIEVLPAGVRPWAH